MGGEILHSVNTGIFYFQLCQYIDGAGNILERFCPFLSCNGNGIQLITILGSGAVRCNYPLSQ